MLWSRSATAATLLAANRRRILRHTKRGYERIFRVDDTDEIESVTKIVFSFTLTPWSNRPDTHIHTYTHSATSIEAKKNYFFNGQNGHKCTHTHTHTPDNEDECVGNATPVEVVKTIDARKLFLIDWRADYVALTLIRTFTPSASRPILVAVHPNRIDDETTDNAHKIHSVPDARLVTAQAHYN